MGLCGLPVDSLLVIFVFMTVCTVHIAPPHQPVKSDSLTGTVHSISQHISIPRTFWIVQYEMFPHVLFTVYCTDGALDKRFLDKRFFLISG